ncbi:MAG: HAD-IA family hydrolase [Nitrospiraceae bacterium]|nr:HAD-IA family hydrolase [Nitrospiraceae bacterium]
MSMKNLKKTKLIIFDLDGTLADSSMDITNALNFSLEHFNYKPLTKDDVVKLVGDGLTRLVEKILGDKNAVLKKDVLDRFLNYYSKHLSDNTKLYPGIITILEQLDSYKKAVISNKMEFLSKRLLEQLNIIHFFDIVIGSDSVSEKKPSPLPIKKVLETLDVKPDEAVIVGDSDIDIQAGKRAGIKTIAVTYGYRSRNLLKNADFIIDDIRELSKLLEH